MDVSLPPLPDLQAASVMDERLRQVVPDRDLLDRAERIANAHLADARRRGDEPALARALGYLGELHRMAGRFEDAHLALAEALAIATRRSDPRVRVAALIRLGELERCSDRYDAAEALLREALTLTGDEDTAGYRHFALQHLGKVFLNAGRLAEAITTLEAALAIRWTLGQPALVASTEEALAAARDALGRH